MHTGPASSLGAYADAIAFDVDIMNAVARANAPALVTENLPSCP